MAEIQMTREQAATTACWPELCARCGAGAGQFVALPQRRLGKNVERLEVPLCQRHLDHWNQYAQLTRFALLVGLTGIVLTGLACWFVFEPLAPGQRFNANAWPALLTLPWLIGALLVLPFALYLGYPIHIRENSTNWITLAGLSGMFVKAWKDRHAAGNDLSTLFAKGSRASEKEPLFHVFPYRPDGVCPWPGTYYLFLTALFAGILVGWAVGAGGLELGTFTQGWDSRDVRYLGIITGLAWLHGLLIFLVVFGIRPGVVILVWLSLFMVPVAFFVAGVAFVLALIPGQGGQNSIVPLPLSASICLNVLPVLLVALGVHTQVLTQKVRSSFSAGLAGLLGPLLVILVGCWQIWGTTAFDLVLPIGGGFFALVGVTACVSQARSPFCSPCETWMQREVLGGLSRPAEMVAEVVQRGELARLQSELVRETVDAGDVELAAYICPNCQAQGTLVLHAVAVLKSNKGTEHKNLGWWVYPSGAWPVLRKLFPKWRAEEKK